MRALLSQGWLRPTHSLSLSASAATAQWYLCYFYLCLCYCFYFHFNFPTFISTIALQPHRQTLCVCSFLSQFTVNCANKKKKKIAYKGEAETLGNWNKPPNISVSLSLSLSFLAVCVCVFVGPLLKCQYKINQLAPSRGQVAPCVQQQLRPGPVLSCPAPKVCAKHFN